MRKKSFNNQCNKVSFFPQSLQMRTVLYFTCSSERFECGKTKMYSASDFFFILPLILLTDPRRQVIASAVFCHIGVGSGLVP